MNTPPQNETIACAFGVVLLIVFGTGLSNPEGIGVPIWPAAGLIAAWVWAHGIRSLPAVFASTCLGSWIVAGLALSALPLALTVAVGATLEAGLLHVVMSGKSSDRSPLVHGRLLVLAALVAPAAPCALTAFGVDALGASATSMPLDACVRWIAHTLGILLFGPMFVFALLPGPAGRQRGRRLIASLTLLALLITFNFIFARERLNRELDTDARAATLAAAASVELGLSRVAELVFNLASYFEASENVSADEFELFVRPPLERLGAIESLMWIALDESLLVERATLRYSSPEPPGRLHDGDLLQHPDVGPLLGPRDRSRVVVGQLSAERGRGSFLAVAWSDNGHTRGWAAAEVNLHEFLLHAFQGSPPVGLELRTSRAGGHSPDPLAARVFFGDHPVDVMLESAPVTARNRRDYALLLAHAVGTLFAAAVVLFLLVVTAHNAELGVEIGSRREAERRLERLADELERSNRDLEAFASGASHDLRAPLRAITGLTAVVLEDEGDRLTADARDMLGLVRKRADRLENMIRGLLAYARTGADGETGYVDLATLVGECIETAVVPAAFAMHVQVPRTAQVRRAALQAVLTNLIANAVRHHDRPHGNIGISAHLVGERLEWIVEDDGPGVPEADREKIFDVFTTLRARDEVESSGMGLATVRRIVEREGGGISCESGSFRGARMRFSWPVPAEDPQSDTVV